MQFIIKNKQDVYKHFKRIKNKVKYFHGIERGNGKIIITMAIFGHEVEEKDIYLFENKQYYNLFMGLLIDYQLFKKYYK